MTRVLAWMTSPEFLPILYYFITLLGVAATYVFSIHRGFERSVVFLKQLCPGRSNVFYRWCDLILVLSFGSLIGTIFFTPSSILEAFAAGVGWTGAFNTLMSQVKN
jgi:hypothetical protein